MEEGITCEDIGSLEQPVVEHPLLFRRRMEPVPGLDAAAGGAEPRQPELRAVALGDGGELVELRHVFTSDHHADFEPVSYTHLSVPAYRMRLHRARIRLAVASGAREHLQPQPHVPPAPARARALAREHPSLHGPELVL